MVDNSCLSVLSTLLGLTSDCLRQSVDLHTSLNQVDSLGSSQETIEHSTRSSKLLGQFVPFLGVLDLFLQVLGEGRSMVGHTVQVFQIWSPRIQGGQERMIFKVRDDL